MDMIAALLTNDLPDIVSIDVDKQEVGAIETAAWLKEHYPSIKVLPLSIEIVESLIKPVLYSGAVGDVLKTAEPGEMKMGR
ncbi:MAG TPA: hypothetical protein VM884_09370 [Flavisolibacter sp.]|nr:hypothetical protein [Flavisolibacter sp.]